MSSAYLNLRLVCLGLVASLGVACAPSVEGSNTSENPSQSSAGLSAAAEESPVEAVAIALPICREETYPNGTPFYCDDGRPCHSTAGVPHGSVADCHPNGLTATTDESATAN